MDCTESMVKEALANAMRLGLDIDIKVGDSRDLEFEDSSFDIVVSRNVAWTLIDAEKAYQEWFRVLKPGGRALIFDANWNYRHFNAELQKEYEADLEEYKTRYPNRRVPFYTDEMIEFRKKMPQCARLRPHWDLGALLTVGFLTVYCDMTIGKKVYDAAERLLHRSSPMFLIKAVKK
jgi:SAM-dependent methyltransferase